MKLQVEAEFVPSSDGEEGAYPSTKKGRKKSKRNTAVVQGPLPSAPTLTAVPVVPEAGAPESLPDATGVVEMVPVPISGPMTALPTASVPAATVSAPLGGKRGRKHKGGKGSKDTVVSESEDD